MNQIDYYSAFSTCFIHKELTELTRHFYSRQRSKIKMKCTCDQLFVAIIFFGLGMGTLLPWNFFITAFDYFNERLNTSSSNSPSSDQKDRYMFNNMCVLMSQLPLLLFTLLNSFLYHRIPEKMRIAGSMVFILLLFTLTAALVKIEMEQDLFFSITMATIWFINMFGAVMQGSLFGLVGKFPPRYNSLFMSGQAVAGIFSAIAMLMSKINKTDNKSSALGYFITPCAATLVTLCFYLMLPHMKLAKLYLEGGNEKKEKLFSKQKENVTLITVKHGEIDPCGPTEASKSMHMETQEEKSPVFEVFKKIWVMALCVTCVFAVTLSVFPAVTVLVEPDRFKGELKDIFTALFCFLVFNVMDWIGRSITSVLQWPSKESCLFPISVMARVTFIPALMMCNIPSRTYLPTIFSNEFAYLAIMSLFALSNGYSACLCMSYAPQLVRAKDAETAGALMTFFLALGLSLGAASSFGLKLLV